MKKIVALVLSLVMVLGLATTAFAATKPAITWTELEGTYDLVAVNDADGKADAGNVGLTFYVSNAKAPKDTDYPKDGEVDEYGWVKGFTANAKYYVQVPTLAAADFVVYYTGTKTVLGYFVDVVVEDNLYYLGKAAAFTNFGDDCGQLDLEPAEDTDYYVFEGVVYEESAWTGSYTEVLLVGNEQVPVNVFALPTADEWVGHTAVFTYDKDYEVTAIECSECGVVAVIYPNLASVPAADKAAKNVFAVNGDEFYCWTTATKAPAVDADKVESAETFDAGIAMYVGMSVMAAAGSAVVLKKKD